MQKKQNAQPRNAELSARNNSADPTTTVPAAIVLSGGVMPRVDSRVLAQHMGVQHKNTLELLQTHKAAFLEFGKVAFQTEALPGSRTGQKERFALLNEDHAYFLLSLSRNTPRVVGLKVNLVRAFGQARKAAQQRQTEYLPSYHLAHDALKGLAPDQQRQHYLHMNVNKLLNKVAGIDAGKRGTAQQGSLALLTVGQMLTAQAVAGAGDHKTAYERIKNALQPLQTLLPAGGTAAC
ncbi:MAG: Rha family transcriptional regulator [Acidovorax sp.]|jgi:phage regulator Rha-like protein|nr:Rha family transcriptional regulator [Acidovorax sp.]